VQQEPLRVRHVRLDGDVRERRVADHEIVGVLGQRGLGEIVLAHAPLGIQQAGNARGGMVELEAVVVGARGDVRRHQAGEVAHTHAGLEHLAALEAQALRSVPHGAHDVLGGVVGVLQRSAGRGVLGLAQ
jgi:hypothetical protein